MDIKKSSAVMAVVLLTAVPAMVAAQSKQQSKQGAPRPKAAASSADSVYTPALAEAERALEKKDYPRAEALFKQVLAKNDKNPRAWFYLGSLYDVTGRKPEAIAALERSVALKPDVFESNLNLGLLLASAGKSEEAAKYLRTATTLKPSHGKTADQDLGYAWMSLGRVLEETQPAAALEAFGTAARLMPKSPDPHLEAAKLSAKRKDYSGAEREYQQALSLAPTSSEAMSGLVNVFIEQKRLPDAEAMLRKYVASNQSDPAAHKLLGQIYAEQQRYDEAMAAFDQALKNAPSNLEVKRELADVATSAKKYDVAEKIYRELTQATPDDPRMHFAFGTFLMKQRKFPEAQAELLRALKLDPKLGAGYGNLAIVASENQQYQLALMALDQRAKLMPEDAGTYFLRATCYDHLKAFPQASENYRKFLEVAEGKFPTQEWQARHRLIAIEPKK